MNPDLRLRFAIPLLCSLALMFPAILLPQEKGAATQGKIQGKGNNLIRPLAELEFVRGRFETKVLPFFSSQLAF
jgi:hypothetical protein